MPPISRYWLMKSEPEVFSINDLNKAPNRTTYWEGVRNYQARNLLRDEIQKGDGVLFYHSSAKPSGIAGEAVVVRGGYPDTTALDPGNRYFDPRSCPEKPIWYRVDVKFVRVCSLIITLPRLREVAGLKNMWVLRRGMRLSVQPITKKEWQIIMKLSDWN